MNIHEILIEEKELEARLLLLRKAKKALQDLCMHKHPNGSDAYVVIAQNSHHQFEKCSICDHELKV